ncbi:MAG: hypothetical protein HZC55_04985 [Verrucomicrobia bacterium]|nr:hypothetical protein [Verrucomicrobiota bacterium]
MANEPFPGAILTTAGQELRGRPTALLPWTTRLRHWLVTQPATAAATVAIAFAAGWGLPFLLRRLVRFVFQRRTDPDFAGHPRAPHGSFLATAAVCVASFSAVITGPSFRLFDAESFGQFYDYQMASLLAGRLDVPEAALSSESFLHDGKFYGYFGPTPALLRLPFALAGLGFGRLSRLYMVLYYAGALIAAYALLIQASRWLSRRPTWPGRGSVVVLVGSAGLGSTLFFLGSRAYIYHEAILCGVLFALWSASASLRWLAEPTRHRWWLLALAGGVLSVHSRPPTGLFALGVLGLTAAALLVRSWQDGRRTTGGDPENLPARECLRWPLPAAVGLLAIGGVLSFNVLSYLKFRSFEGAQLRYHVQYHAERLAVTEGRNFHVANVPFGLANYFWRPGLLVRPTFPYVYIDGCDPAGFPGCRIDLAEKTLGLPYAMPALVLLSGFAVVTAVFRWPAARLPTGILVAGVLPMTLALLAAIAVSQRYTGDFVPFLVATGAFGVAALDAWVPAARRNLFGLASVLSVAGMLLTFAITLHYQGEGVWGVPDATRARYLALRHHADHFLGFSSP